MKTTTLTFLTVFIFLANLHAQERESRTQRFVCGTVFNPTDIVHLPHFGQNVILEQILDITMGGQQRNTLDASNIGILPGDVPFHIPVKIWVYRDDNGTNTALSDADVQFLFAEVNRIFAQNNTGIQFYMKCAVEHVNSTRFNRNIRNDNDLDAMFTTHHEPFALNWHLIHTNPPDWYGIAVFPWQRNNFRFAVGFSGWSLNEVINITVHEIGHTLGLLHTHENIRQDGFNGFAGRCFQESVSRSRRQGINCLATVGRRKCEINGDALCCTEAAPWGWVQESGCVYIGRGTDNWGDRWRPPLRNFMSIVSSPLCMTEFTRGQIAVMHMNIIRWMDLAAPVWPIFLLSFPWYNLHSISLSGIVNSGENETFIVPLRVEAALGNSTYTINSGGSVNIFAGESIVLSPGFHAKAGSSFTARVGTLIDCSSISPFSSTANSLTSRSESTPIAVGLSQENTEKALSIITRALNREFMDVEHDEIATERTSEDCGCRNFSFSISPNPANDIVTIDYTLYADAPIGVNLYNMFGQRVKEILPQQTQMAGHYSIQASISNLATGTYFIRITSGRQSETLQLVISR